MKQPGTKCSLQDKFMGETSACLCLGPGSSKRWEMQVVICLLSKGWWLYAQTPPGQSAKAHSQLPGDSDKLAGARMRSSAWMVPPQNPHCL